MEPAPNQTQKTPGDFLKSIRGKRVVVKLNSGVDYRGIYTLLFSLFDFFLIRSLAFLMERVLVQIFVLLLIVIITNTSNK
jgi:hypothetical protein